MVMLERPVEVNELLDGLIARMQDLVSGQGSHDGMIHGRDVLLDNPSPTSPVPSVKRSGRFFDRETSSCWKATSVPEDDVHARPCARVRLSVTP